MSKSLSELATHVAGALKFADVEAKAEGGIHSNALKLACAVAPSLADVNDTDAQADAIDAAFREAEYEVVESWGDVVALFSIHKAKKTGKMIVETRTTKVHTLEEIEALDPRCATSIREHISAGLYGSSTKVEDDRHVEFEGNMVRWLVPINPKKKKRPALTPVLKPGYTRAKNRVLKYVRVAGVSELNEDLTSFDLDAAIEEAEPEKPVEVEGEPEPAEEKEARTPQEKAIILINSLDAVVKQGLDDHDDIIKRLRALAREIAALKKGKELIEKR